MVGFLYRLGELFERVLEVAYKAVVDADVLVYFCLVYIKLYYNCILCEFLSVAGNTVR